MAGHPYWSGQLRISLVSFGIQIFPATNPASEISFHQIDRKTGQRIHHLNVVDGHQPVDNSEIVKGFEYSKGKYITFEPDETKKLRLETLRTIDIAQFVAAKELQRYLFERPYFVVPDPKVSDEAFVIVQRAMADADKAAIGEVAFAGREHLIAIAASPDKRSSGMMAYTLRYAEELRNAEDYFSKTHEHKIGKKELELANELIRAHSEPFRLESYRDDYEAALRGLIEAKRRHAPLPTEEKPKKAKVINLMEALRRSLDETTRPNTSPRKTTQQRHRKGPSLVKSGKRSRKAA